MSASELPTTREPKWAVWAVSGFLLLVVAVIYGQALHFDFIHYDDNLYVFDNPDVKAGLTGHGLMWAFTNGPSGEFYPLAMLSHMLDCQLYELNAGGHHLTNVLWHAATAIALFLVLRSMTGELWPSAFVATLFAIHPQNVESVAWIAERRDMLSGFFFVLTLAAYVGYVRHGRTRRPIPARGAGVVAGADGQAHPGHGAGTFAAFGFLAAGAVWPGFLSGAVRQPTHQFGDGGDVVRQGRTLQDLPQRQSFWWLVVEKLPLMVPRARRCRHHDGHP